MIKYLLALLIFFTIPIAGIASRNKEPLEKFPVEELQFIRIADKQECHCAYVQASNGEIIRVKVGNYLGKNLGMIIEISEDHIKIRETLYNKKKKQWINRDRVLSIKKDR